LHSIICCLIPFCIRFLSFSRCQSVIVVAVALHPVFRVVDLATGEDFIYEDFYTLKVIAITDSPEIEPRWFTEEEIAKYNNMN